MPATPAPQLAPISLYALVGVLWRAGWLGALYGGVAGTVVGFIWMIFSGSLGFALLGAFYGGFIGGTGGFTAGVLGTSLDTVRGYIGAGFLGGAAMFPIVLPPVINAWIIGSMALGGLAGALMGVVVGKEMQRAAPRFFFLAELKSAIELSGLQRLPFWKRTGLAMLFLCLTLIPLSAVLHGTAG